MYSRFGNQEWITPYGLLFVGATLTCWWLARRNAMADERCDPSHLDLLIPLSLMAGLAGGALLSVLTPADRELAGDLMRSGVRIRLFGLLATGSVAVFVYGRLARLSVGALFDVLALPVVFGLALHRIGCFLGGCCWGDVSVHDSAVAAMAGTDLGRQVQTLPWLAGEWVRTGVQFPPGSFAFEQHVAMGLLGPGAAGSLPVHPVQLYEAGLLLAIFLPLTRIRLGQQPSGTLALTVAVLYATQRFFVEYLRADGVLVAGSLSIVQLQSLAIIVLGGVWLARLIAAGLPRPH